MTVSADPHTAPFACRDDDGVVDHSVVVRRRAIQCALSRICGVCGQTLSRPIAFLGPEDEALDGLFTFPPAHVECAEDALERFVAFGDGVLGQREAPRRWVLVTTAGFDLVRPAHRGEPVRFRPNSVLTTTARWP
ncbi:hypothetical protein [Aeromicrobium wangtongii]|uniref:hypothetical protein n=1 Tax=Aeromicrobium wangtongii TaxID=2969247 RepID=UPI002016F8BD|nr:hypothetical protein [Aeromicrobium wangtongii]MCL3817313.1 hypothetical protein [Aeromicrobium wangtongii]